MKEFSLELIPFSIAIFFSTIGFSGYYFFNERLHKKFGEGSIRQVITQRLNGFLILGVLPLALLLYFNSGEEIPFLSGSFQTSSILWLIGISILLIAVNYLHKKSKSNLLLYPQIKESNWNPSLLLLSAVTWIAYLLAYEFLFRGLLLSSSLELMGFWPAIIINTGIYSLVHIHKGIVEGLGSVVMGLILCLLVIQTGSFWIAFFIHIVLALSNEWFSISAQTNMQFNLRK